MNLVLDAGALVALDRRDRRMRALLRTAQDALVPVSTSAGVVAQVWRDGARQTNLSRALAGVAAVPLDLTDAKHVGRLLGASGTRDVVDAHLASLVRPGDQVLTSDPDDLRVLLDARSVKAKVVHV